MARRGAGSLLFVSATLLLVAACSSEAGSESEGQKEAGGAKDDVAWAFTTRPDLTPPRIDVTTTDAGASADDGGDDLVFLGVKDQREKNAPMNGPVIADTEGNPVWVAPQGDTRWTYDLRVQEYDGEPVLTWWRGDTFEFGYGEGEFVLMDQSYREIATVTTPGTHADFHDARLTSDGTALLLSYPVVQRDLSEVDGPEDGYLRDSVVHEVDVETGEELFRWSALDNIPLTETETTIDPEDEEQEEGGTEDAPFDPYHFNSVTEDDGNALLVSARNTHAVYRVERGSGELDWTLGGKGSDFEMVGESAFAWQHDAERQDDGTITLFDNEAAPEVREESRGLKLDVDPDAGTCEIVTTYAPPDGRLSESQGNLEVLDDGSVFIGWGSNPFYSHYTADGELLQDAELAGGISYRAYRQAWVGDPSEPPKFLQREGRAYVSWNGATEVDRWRFIAGYDEESAETVETVEATGFETSAEIPDAAYIGAQALDASGTVLATAEPGAWP